MKNIVVLFFSCLAVAGFFNSRQPKPPGQTAQAPTRFFAADDPSIQYTGRIDFSDPKRPRFWSPGVYIRVRFSGTNCTIILHDEMLYGNTHNYIAVVVDERPPIRLKLKGNYDTLQVATRLPEGEHTLTICKNTESGIGYLEFLGIVCHQLLPPYPLPSRKIEFIGNSITCGTGSDLSEFPCGQGQWYDQHNAWMSYGPVTARLLNANWHLTAVSGIGLIHSCCNMKITMPQVFDKVNLRNDSLGWDFSRYIPDVVTICLGQNDGIQDSTAFCIAYTRFIGTIRSHYPDCHIICLTSPMADEKLVAIMKNYLHGIVDYMHRQGDNNVYTYFYSKQYHHGCGGHPDLEEHQQIALELVEYIKKTLHW